MDRRFKLARFSLVFFALGMVGIINTGFGSALLFIFLCLALGVIFMVYAVVHPE